MPDTPTNILMAEHRIIEKVIAAMRRFADALSSGQDVDRQPLSGLVPFMRQFADAHHHGKEEHRLFPVLVACGLPAQNGPVQIMCSEHETGRQMVARLAAAIDAYGNGAAETRENLADALRAIAEFYSQHIWKEDNVLFPMAERVLDADSTANVLVAFREVTMPEDQRQGFIAYAESLG
ncbi:hemerythrin domain-containing protein [Telmatospirillum sp.]|uniref:hemerythrin domain-containing protein n=1 Tax=Telmatospirillum sp. TaxID=2079197 RepID=UPI00284C511F|nr:hemerythrin domain-containing protein [Telmatospirillum sp.]MDR3437681.1 hemerythrin domain-containing protein [Telmatospirillum sp.]